MVSEIGKFLIVIGVFLVLLGMVLWGLGWTGLPLGSLPGDIRIEREKFAFYFPVVTCIVLSVVLTLLLSALSWFFHR